MKIPVDINKFRENILNPCELEAIDDVFTFYYDETYNPRRLTLESGATNSPIHECFVLGGVMHRGHTLPNFDLATLKKAMHIQKNVVDLKFFHVANSKYGFVKCLNSKKLTPFLEWLMESDFYVHFIAVDKLYWSFVDLVDSVVPRELMLFATAYKSSFGDLISMDVNGFLRILDAYAYPNVQRNAADKFLRDIVDYINKSPAAVSVDERLSDFRDLVLQCIGKEDLRFIMDEQDRTLIESFIPFYIDRICRFPHSRHVLDDEAEIAQKLSERAFMLDGLEIKPYSFVTSHKSDLIQIADVVVGAFGKFYSYLTTNSFEDIEAARAAMTPIQKRNVSLLCKVMEQTSEVSGSLLTSVVNPNFFAKKQVLRSP